MMLRSVLSPPTAELLHLLRPKNWTLPRVCSSSDFGPTDACLFSTSSHFSTRVEWLHCDEHFIQTEDQVQRSAIICEAPLLFKREATRHERNLITFERIVTRLARPHTGQTVTPAPVAHCASAPPAPSNQLCGNQQPQQN